MPLSDEFRYAEIIKVDPVRSAAAKKGWLTRKRSGQYRDAAAELAEKVKYDPWGSHHTDRNYKLSRQFRRQAQRVTERPKPSQHLKFQRQLNAGLREGRKERKANPRSDAASTWAGLSPAERAQRVADFVQGQAARKARAKQDRTKKKTEAVLLRDYAAQARDHGALPEDIAHDQGPQRKNALRVMGYRGQKPPKKRKKIGRNQLVTQPPRMKR